MGGATPTYTLHIFKLLTSVGGFFLFLGAIMARPQITLDDKQIAQVEALASVLTLEQIADYFGVARNTFDAICKRQPEVFEHYKKGKTKAIASVAQNLIKQAQDGNTTAIIFFLKTQAGWKETQVIDNTSSDGTMTPQQVSLDEILKARKEILDEY